MSRKLYRWTLVAYPPSFRNEYGDEMAETFAVGLQSATGLRARLGFVLRSGLDLGVSAARLRLDSRRGRGKRDADHGFARLGGPGRRGSRAGGDRTAIDGLLNDLRFSARSLLHRPGFAAIALITLAVGIGANVAMFSLVKATLLQSLGYGEPEQLVTLHSAIAREGIEFGQTSMADFLDIRERNRAFEAVSLWSFRSASVATDEGAVWISGVAATTNIFDLLQVRPLLGSTFAIGDDGPDGPRNVVISEGLWNTLFGGRAEAIGESLRLDGVEHTVVGIVADDAAFPGGTQLWVPLPLELENEPRYRRVYWGWRA